MVIERIDRQDRGHDALTEFRDRTPSINHVRSRGATGGRDPAHELYEHAAGLLTTAQALEAATHDARRGRRRGPHAGLLGGIAGRARGRDGAAASSRA